MSSANSSRLELRVARAERERRPALASRTCTCKYEVATTNEERRVAILAIVVLLHSYPGMVSQWLIFLPQG